MTVQIVEVIRRSDQGSTQPFICRGDDECVYFVKGRSAARRGLISEWIAGKLGVLFGLPIPPFSIVDVPRELIELGGGLDLTELGAGPAFGSLRQEVVELNFAAINDVPDDLQRDVLVFDWWVKNGDRTLTVQGGNPNLFWETGTQKLVVIDHNLAFDTSFNSEDFRDTHVFSKHLPGVFGDFFRRQAYQAKFESAVQGWGDIRDSVPEEWLFTDPEMTVPAGISLATVHQVLQRYDQTNFWDV